MSLFLTDNFTGSNGTLLTAHTSDSGHSWTQHPAFSTSVALITTNRMSPPDTANPHFAAYSNATPASTEYDVTVDVFVRASVTTSMFIGGRFSTSAQTGYQLELNYASGDIGLVLYKANAGSLTSLGTYSIVAPAVSSTITIKLEIRDAAKKVYVNGTERISSANNDITVAGSVVVGLDGGGSTVTGMHFDSLTAGTTSVDAALTFPMFTLAAGSSGSALTWPMFTVAALGPYGAGLTWPMFTVASSGVVGAIGSAALTMPMFIVAGIGGPATVANLIWPIFTVAATGTYAPYGNITWPMFSVEATTTNPCEGILRWPMFEVRASAVNSPLITADIIWPVFSIESFGANIADITWPMFEVVATGIVGSIASFDQRWPMFEVIARGETGKIIAGTCIFPMPQVAGTALVGGIGTADLTWPMFIGLGSGHAGTVSAASFTWPLFTVLAAAHGPLIASADLRWPMFQISGNISQAVDTVFRTWVLNIRKAALTEYDNFAFNSMTNFKGKILAAGPSGIFQLAAQNTDNSAGINANILTGQNDFGSSMLKRIPRIYVGYKSSGDMEFHTITSQDGARKYLLSINACLGLQQRRIPIGRGPKSRYWQFGLVNRDGTDFLIESILIYPEQTHRRNI